VALLIGSLEIRAGPRKDEFAVIGLLYTHMRGLIKRHVPVGGKL